MSEPDSVNDTVFYEPKTLHYSQGLNIKGSVSLNDFQLEGNTITVPKAGWYYSTPGAYATLASASSTNGRAIISYFDNDEEWVCDQIASGVVTTPGSAGALLRSALWVDDGSLLLPGALLMDGGAINAETTGVKASAGVEVIIPKGRIWYTTIIQGAPATRPTIPITTGHNVKGFSSSIAGSALGATSHIVDGITDALPNPCSAPTSFTTFAVPVRLRRKA